MQPAICLLSVIPMRKEPSHRSEMVSQILFGEYVRVGEERDDFVFVKCMYDDYEGWVQANQLISITEDQIQPTANYTGVFTTEVLVNNGRRNVPFAVPVYRPNEPRDSVSFGKQNVGFTLPDDAIWSSKEKSFNRENVDSIVQVFLDTPYLWGGKSVFGIDCSGFAQQVFKLFGVKLLRDAYLQATQGTEVANIEESRLGDLAFFQNDTGRITHVGIVLGKNLIAHASGRVRIDPMDREGIVNGETGKRTHRLHSIRRFF